MKNIQVKNRLIDKRRQYSELKKLLFSFGSDNIIDETVRFVVPENISLGNKCEVREHVLFDARSDRKPAITMGNKCRIKSFVSLMAYGGSIELEDNILIGQGTRIFGHNGITIGNHSMIGGGVSVQSVKHLSYRSRTQFQYQGFLKMPPIVIASNVAIGDNSVILPGVTIEKDVHVGAGSVVTRSLESGYYYVGNPARRKKTLPDKPPKGEIFDLKITSNKVSQIKMLRKGEISQSRS
jgi:maltose O-acetyltransferase